MYEPPVWCIRTSVSILITFFLHVVNNCCDLWHTVCFGICWGVCLITSGSRVPSPLQWALNEQTFYQTLTPLVRIQKVLHRFWLCRRLLFTSAASWLSTGTTINSQHDLLRITYRLIGSLQRTIQLEYIIRPALRVKNSVILVSLRYYYSLNFPFKFCICSNFSNCFF